MSETKSKEQPRVHRDRFAVADFTIGKFDHRAQAGITREQLLTPEYWSHVAELMTPWSEITVRPDDGIYYAKFLVRECTRGWAKVKLLEWHDLNTPDVAMSQSKAGERNDYDIVWKGPTKKHVVIRKSDSQVISEGEHMRKEQAEAWLADFLTTKARKAMIDGMPA